VNNPIKERKTGMARKIEILKVLAEKANLARSREKNTRREKIRAATKALSHAKDEQAAKIARRLLKIAKSIAGLVNARKIIPDDWHDSKHDNYAPRSPSLDVRAYPKIAALTDKVAALENEADRVEQDIYRRERELRHQIVLHGLTPELAQQIEQL